MKRIIVLALWLHSLLYFPSLAFGGAAPETAGQVLAKLSLFMDWALSEEGQSMITTFGRVVGRKGVKQRFPELVEKQSLLVAADFIAPILDQTAKEFGQIFLGR